MSGEQRPGSVAHSGFRRARPQAATGTSSPLPGKDVPARLLIRIFAAFSLAARTAMPELTASGEAVTKSLS